MTIRLCITSRWGFVVDVSIEFDPQRIMAQIRPNKGLASAALTEQVLKDSNYYCKARIDHILINSAISHSDPDEGVVQWVTPYARYQYYYPPTRTEVNPNATMQWFETAKAAHLDEWVRLYANLYTGGGTP